MRKLDSPKSTKTKNIYGKAKSGMSVGVSALSGGGFVDSSNGSGSPMCDPSNSKQSHYQMKFAQSKNKLKSSKYITNM